MSGIGPSELAASRLAQAALAAAVAADDPAGIARAIDQGADPDMAQPAEGNGRGAFLSWAIEHAKPLALAALLEGGADPQALDRQGWTPLMAALRFGAERWSARWPLDAKAACVEALLPTGDFRRIYPGGPSVFDAVAESGLGELADRMGSIEAEREARALRGHLDGARAQDALPKGGAPTL